MSRDYDEHFENFDDTTCYLCGEKLPADLDYEVGSPEFDGFCDQACRADNGR